MNEMIRSISRNLNTVLRLFFFAAAAFGFATSDALAQDGRFYVGVTSDVDYLRVKHRKSTINAPNTGALHEGRTYHDSDSSSKIAFGGGLFGGYRLNLGEGGGFYVSAEVDGQIHARSASGVLPGKGDSPGRNQDGESWPDAWNLKRKYSYGATLRFGGLSEFLGSGSSIYALGGVRRMKARLKVDFYGCLDMPTRPCEDDEFGSGKYSQNNSLWGWTAGAGVEKMLGERIGIRSEIRHTRYEKLKRLDVLNEGNLRVPTSNEQNETDFSLSAVVYF